jgi:eukaryotic-like serine/threonine-protein kinase
MSELASRPRPAPPASSSEERLDSWKEIAAYLKRDVSTVQRWEKKEGLPVHRLPHDKLGSVYAFKSELDGWWGKGRQRLEAGEPGQRPDKIGNTLATWRQGARQVLGASRSAVLRRSALALVAFIIGGLAVGLALSNRLRLVDQGASARATSPPPIRFLVDTPPVNANLFDGVPSVAVARDGSVVVYVAAENGVRRLYQRRLGDVSAVPIPGTEGATAPFLSPDARSVGFTVAIAPARLQRVSLAGGAPVTICELGGMRGASWGDDDTIIFSPHPDAGLWRVVAGGGVPEPVTRPDPEKGERSHRWPQYLAEQRLVLYTVAKSDLMSFDDAVIVARDLETGRETELVRGGSYPMYVAATGHLLYPRAGNLLAVPFDPGTQSTRGPSLTVVSDLVTYPFTGAAEVSISEAGVLAMIAGGVTMPQRTVVIVDREGNSEPTAFPPSGWEVPRISPDGRSIALTRNAANASIWISDLSGATSVRLTPEWTNRGGAVWSPDGLRVAYSSGHAGARHLYWQSIDGRGEAEQVTMDGDAGLATSWSSDGRYIAYDYRQSSGARDIFILDTAGQRTSFPFANTRFTEQSAQFSPDAALVAYVSDESGRPEVYMDAFPERGTKTLVSRGGGSAPRWARHGRELYYRIGDAVMAVEVRHDTPTPSVGVPRVLFRKVIFDTAYDVTPDGRFVMIEEIDSPLRVAPLTVTVNWFDDWQTAK